MPRAPAQVAEAIRRLPPELVLKLAEMCDGHTILNPQALIDAGLPTRIAASVTTTYRSDRSSPKTTIFVAGQPVDESRGIYGLDLLHTLAEALGVTFRACYGRGSQAAAIREALHQHFADR